MGPISGVYFKLRAASKRACEKDGGGNAHLKHAETGSRDVL